MSVARTPWSSPHLLPSRADALGWELWRNGKREPCGLAELGRVLKNWQPQSLLLVARPGDVQFVPPTGVPEIANDALNELARRARRSSTWLAVGAIGFSTPGLFVDSSAFLPLAWTCACGLALAQLELHGSARSATALDARVRFVFWFRHAHVVRFWAVAWVLFLVACAALQLTLASRLGSHAAVFGLYGTLYERVSDGEWWRLLTGAALHYSPQHYITNFALLALTGPMVSAAFGARLSLIAFTAGSVLGALGQMTLGGTLHDSCGGLSFGLYALFGVASVAGAFGPTRLPAGMPAQFAFLAVLAIGFTELASPNSATAGHIAGLLTGAAIGLLHAAFSPAPRTKS